MVEQIDNSNPYFAQIICEIFQASYPIEANLLNVELSEFPPLKRTAESVASAETSFYAKYDGDEIVAIMELKFDPDILRIQSLVVHPNHFRKGIGRELIDFAFRSYPVSQYSVETGALNQPAIALYEMMGFEIWEKYLTESEIMKVRMRKSVS